MQNAKWIRFGLTAVILAGGLGAVAVVGCSSSNPATSTDGGKQDGSMMMGTDSGGDDSSMGDSGGNMDGGMEAGPPSAKAYLVNASNFAPTGLRFCFAVASGDPGDGGSVSLVPPYAAAPDNDMQSKAAGLPYPGLFPGLGGQIDTHGVDPANLDLAIYAIDASKIATEVASNATEKKCPDMIGMNASGGTLKLNTDYWYIGHIPAGTLKDGTTWVAGVTGCMPGNTSVLNAAVQCPTGYLATASDLALQMWQVDNMTAVDGGATGVQFIHGSLAWDKFMTDPVNGPGAAATVLGAFEPGAQPPADAGPGDAGDAGDGGGVMPTGPTIVPLVPDAKFGDLKPMSLAAVPGLTDDMNSGVFAEPVGADGGPVMAQQWAYPFPVVEALSGLGTAGKIVPGKGFVFVLVGDPTQPPYVGADGGAADPDAGGQFNIAFPHFLGFPTSNP